jgi:phosphatidylglycerophosphate synthase
MTTAVLLATVAVAEHEPAAAQPWGDATVLARLVDQLASLEVEDVLVITRPGWEPAFGGLRVSVVTSRTGEDDLRAVARIARDGAPGSLLVTHADIVTHVSALDGLLADPRVRTGILASVKGRVGAWRLRSERSRALSVGSPFHSVHDPNASFLGVLKVSEEHREDLADVAERLVAAHLPPPYDVPAFLTVGLVRSGIHMNESYAGELFWARPLSRAELERAKEEIARVDEDRVRLDSAVKPFDGFFTSFFVSPYSKYIARWAARRGFTPNQVTTVSMLIGVAAAAAFALGTRGGMVAGAVLLQVAFTADCVDGQLARYTHTFTKLGAWLDSVFDRGKEYVVFAGLAIGASRSADPVWLLAGAALTLQTVRHAFDFSFAAAEHQGYRVAVQLPLDDPGDGGGGGGRGGAAPAGSAPPTTPSRATRTLAGWRRLNKLPGAIWVKRMAPFPIGERFAAISITAALFTPRTTFVFLLAWGSFAALYTFAGRLLRSFR